jgi:hypothetical protein
MDFVLPVRLVGSLDALASNVLKNGPSVGGALLANGAYNVPLKVIFKCQNAP